MAVAHDRIGTNSVIGVLTLLVPAHAYQQF